MRDALALVLWLRRFPLMKLTLTVVLILLSCVPAVALTIDTVPVGDVGNANDAATGNLYGGVGYAYNIGKYEVTLGQYTAFLNAVGAIDTHALYNPNMATDLNSSGIARSGGSGSYTYIVIGSPKRPVTYVSWGDAARFANWLHNGQPAGSQDASTTEDGAYTLNGATSVVALNAVSRNAGAKWFIPSDNEWYKAAYYQPVAQGGDADNYWNYPMRTNSVPYSDQPPGATPHNKPAANFFQDDGVGNGYDDGFAISGSTIYSSSQNYLTDVGAYTSSPSYYGTFDQGGNVWEWNEGMISLSNGSYRAARGGSWYYGADLAASYQGISSPTDAGFNLGFRVATIVAEPSGISLAVIALTAILLRDLQLHWAIARQMAQFISKLA
jgi:sulfatase modifying factor 1